MDSAEAQRWRDWLLRAIGGSPGRMRIMYRVDGGRHLQEWSVDELAGHQHARPVRIGNAASTQLQVDVWGEVLDALYLGEREAARLPEDRSRPDQARRAPRICLELARCWHMGYSRASPRHYVYSKAMAWAGINCFLRSKVAIGADASLVRRLGVLREEIHEEAVPRRPE